MPPKRLFLSILANPRSVFLLHIDESLERSIFQESVAGVDVCGADDGDVEIRLLCIFLERLPDFIHLFPDGLAVVGGQGRFILQFEGRSAIPELAHANSDDLKLLAGRQLVKLRHGRSILAAAGNQGNQQKGNADSSEHDSLTSL
jgi:hypothetical protein